MPRIKRDKVDYTYAIQEAFFDDDGYAGAITVRLMRTDLEEDNNGSEDPKCKTG
jgi:hypothetical protein